MDASVIFWDFDGVLLRSNHVRDSGFYEVLKGFPEDQVERLLVFHRENGGLSRYVKFRYFFEEIRRERLTAVELDFYTAAFSKIMRRTLVDSALLIQPTYKFVKENANRYKMHIVSGSDQEELRFLCDSLGLSRYFHSIHGSPTPKSDLVKELVERHQYDADSCVLIGDSINDVEAAQENGIAFQAFGNDKLNKFSTNTVAF